jgi:hypothetical protein
LDTHRDIYKRLGIFHFFTYLFLRWLPQKLEVLLTNIDHTDRRVLADKADHLVDLFLHPERFLHTS